MTILFRSFFLILLAAALPVEAATLSVTSAGPLAGVGQEMVLSVRFVPEGSAVNVVEGAIRIPSGVVVDRIDTGGSALTLWPEAPTFVVADSAVEFLGGSPVGLSSSAESLLFTIHAHARNIGTYEFSSVDSIAYRNDGSGGTIALDQGGATLAVDDSNVAQHAQGSRAHSPLVIDHGSESTLYDGQAFIAFFGGDAGKGVDHYEVREGWWGKVVIAKDSYVLRDQSLHSTLWVSAVAPDGTKVTKALPAERTDSVAILSVVLIVLGLALVAAIVRRLRA